MRTFTASLGSVFEVVDAAGTFEAVTNTYEVDVVTLVRLGDGEIVPENRKVPTGGTPGQYLTPSTGGTRVWADLPESDGANVLGLHVLYHRPMDLSADLGLPPGFPLKVGFVEQADPSENAWYDADLAGGVDVSTRHDLLTIENVSAVLTVVAAQNIYDPENLPAHWGTVVELAPFISGPDLVAVNGVERFVVATDDGSTFYLKPDGVPVQKTIAQILALSAMDDYLLGPSSPTRQLPVQGIIAVNGHDMDQTGRVTMAPHAERPRVTALGNRSATQDMVVENLAGDGIDYESTIRPWNQTIIFPNQADWTRWDFLPIIQANQTGFTVVVDDDGENWKLVPTGTRTFSRATGGDPTFTVLNGITDVCLIDCPVAVDVEFPELDSDEWDELVGRLIWLGCSGADTLTVLGVTLADGEWVAVYATPDVGWQLFAQPGGAGGGSGKWSTAGSYIEPVAPLGLAGLMLNLYGESDQNHKISYGFTKHGIDGPVINGFEAVGFALGSANTDEDEIVGKIDVDGYHVRIGGVWYLLMRHGTPAGGVLSGNLPSPGFAVPMATQDELDTGLASKADLVGGTVPSAQLPSYVDDVLEYTNLAAFPGTGESGKIYVALDTNLTYRWTGSVYGVLDPSLALGETSGTAYRGDRGKTAYDTALAAVPKSLFDANTILAATTDDTPVALTVAASRFVGRKSSGDITAMTPAEAKTELALVAADIPTLPPTKLSSFPRLWPIVTATRGDGKFGTPLADIAAVNNPLCGRSAVYMYKADCAPGTWANIYIASISTGTTGDVALICIYAAAADGGPGALVTTYSVNVATAGIKTVSGANYAFAGTEYVGVFLPSSNAGNTTIYGGTIVNGGGPTRIGDNSLSVRGVLASHSSTTPPSDLSSRVWDTASGATKLASTGPMPLIWVTGA